jgi:REP element-mobilizing transposase RayT
VGYHLEQHSRHWMVGHIICSPKRRHKILVGPIHDRLQQLIEQLVQEHEWQMLKLIIQLDPVHLFLHSHPYMNGYCTMGDRVFLAHAASGVPFVVMHVVRLDQEHVLQNRKHREE